MNYHPAANLFPLMDAAELNELAADIAANGLMEPIWLHPDGSILDGRNRWRACEIANIKPKFRTWVDDGSPVAFVVSLNLRRRQLTTSQSYAIGAEALPMLEAEAKKRQAHGQTAPGKTLEAKTPQANKNRAPQARDIAAKLVGVGARGIQDAKKIKEEAPELFQQVKAGNVTLRNAKKKVQKEQKRKDLTAAQKTINTAKQKSIESVCDLRVCSCAELFASGIKPDAVITDPPYPAEFLPVFSELAEGCKRANVPLVAVMSGQSYLPEVMQRLCEHLQYRWTLAYLTPGGQAVQQWVAKVNTTWKPILLFGDAIEWFGDVATSKVNDNDKRFHTWGQSESGMADLVERLTKPGQLICDPFLGGGTTAVVSLALGRRFVGCDIDAAHVEQTRQRVMI